jgi:transcriptional regulator with XRE-family HTH domain
MKDPDLVDRHVGSRLRLLRMQAGMSQEALGKRLGLTFQQVQKYEKGQNRIGASRLYQLSRILRAPVGFFFEGLPDETEAGAAVSSPSLGFLSTSEGYELNLAFSRIRDAGARRKIVELVQSLAAAPAEDDASR